MSSCNPPTLIIQQKVAAPPDLLFQLWTDPEHLVKWWGPEGIQCSGAQLNLIEGGDYKILNKMPSGDVLEIFGQYKVIDPPNKLKFTWNIKGSSDAEELVTVLFKANGEDTDVTIIHESISSRESYRNHKSGWEGCLNGLSRHSTA